MQNSWVICPFSAEYPSLLMEKWRENLRLNVASIGWNKVGDVIGKSRHEIQCLIDRAYPGKSPRGGSTIWSFLNDIQIGDTIVARSNLSEVLGIGRVTRQGFFDPRLSLVGNTLYDEHQLYIGVSWDIKFLPRTMPNPRFIAMGTLRRLTPERLSAIQGASPAQSFAALTPTAVIDDESIEAAVANPRVGQFALEKYLEAFLVDHFHRIFGTHISIYSSSDGEEDGQQFETDIGRIDILAYDVVRKEFVVIELKKGARVRRCCRPGSALHDLGSSQSLLRRPDCAWHDRVWWI